PELLARALRSLLAQRHPPLEILVVDNAPSNELTRELLEREFPMVRYVREPTGRYLACLDDDAVAGPDWAAAIEEVLAESPRIGACMGKVDALTLETAGARLFEANGGFARGD